MAQKGKVIFSLSSELFCITNMVCTVIGISHQLPKYAIKSGLWVTFSYQPSPWLTCLVVFVIRCPRRCWTYNKRWPVCLWVQRVRYSCPSQQAAWLSLRWDNSSWIPIHCLSVADPLDLQHKQDISCYFIIKICSPTSPWGEWCRSLCKRGNATCCDSGTLLFSWVSCVLLRCWWEEAYYNMQILLKYLNYYIAWF